MNFYALAKLNIHSAIFICFVLFTLSLSNSYGQSFNWHFNSNAGEIWGVDKDNNSSSEDFIWIVDQNSWTNGSNTEKMRLGASSLKLNVPINLNDNALYLRSDNFHALRYCGSTSTFAGVNLDGPVLYGTNGGGLGSNFLDNNKITIRWNSDGNVGIGTATPTQKLDVNGNINANGILNTTGNIVMSGTDFTIDNTGRRGGATGSNRRALVHDSGDRLTINYGNDYTGGVAIGANNYFLANGNVGIGTTTPTAKLDVNGNSHFSGNIRISSAENIYLDYDTNHGLGYYGGSKLFAGVGINGPVLFGYGGGALGSLNGNAIALRWTADGKVGIGTTSPGAKLELNGNMRAVNELRFSNGTTMKGLVWGSTDWSGYFSRIDDYEGNLRLLTDDSFFLGKLNTSGTPTGSYTLFADVNSGNVGIGTTSPTQRLQVQGNGYFTGTMGIGTAPVSDIQLKVKGSFDVTSSSDSTIFHVSTGKQLVFVGTNAYNQFLATQNDPNSDIQENNYSLWVSKGVVSEDYAIADVAEWDDYVFSQDYELPSLKSVAAFIAANKHLPNIPSEAEVKKNGYSLHTLNRSFLKTMEEMTLYAIEQEQKLEKQQAQIDAQQQEIDTLKAQMAIILELLNKK